MSGADAAISLFERMWNAADDRLTAMKDEGNLVIQCTSDIYLNYEKSLEDKPLESAFAALQQGRKGLHWHGIPIVDVKVGSYLSSFADMPQSFAILTDKRNMALAVNTADFPGNEVRMWYNPRRNGEPPACNLHGRCGLPASGTAHGSRRSRRVTETRIEY